MKSGLAVMLELASTLADPAVDVTYVFYVCEEVAREHNGLSRLFVLRPDLLAGDVAILGEPTDGAVEAGCQGVLKIAVTLRGERAHSARPWMGVNAIHRLAPLLGAVAAFGGRQPEVDGCRVPGGPAGRAGRRAGWPPTWCPTVATVLLNHRFAPDRDASAALAAVTDLLAPCLDHGERRQRRTRRGGARGAAGTRPSACWPVWSRPPAGRPGPSWVGPTWPSSPNKGSRPPTSARAIPTLAHTAGERVQRADIEQVHQVLAALAAG